MSREYDDPDLPPRPRRRGGEREDPGDAEEARDRPRSGRPRPGPGKANNTALKVILGVVGGVVLLGCLGVGGCIALIGLGAKKQAAEDRQVAAGPALAITADALHSEYDANEVAADEKYKGKVLEVTGTVKEIGKDILDDQYVALQLPRNQFMTSVHCSFPAGASKELAQLRKGQRVTIRGKCKGFGIGTVQLGECSLR